MAIAAVHYQYIEDVDAVARVRPEHRRFLGDLYERGVVLASGPLGEGGSPGALILVRADDAAQALSILDADPMNREGMIVDRRAQSWTQAYGPF